MEEGVSLPRGSKLTGSEVDAVASLRPSSIIVLGGEPGAGKTTLLTALYEQFRRGPFASHTFGGSRTLPAFEQLCHPSRVASGRAEPETDRTSVTSTPEFLHLSLIRRPDGHRTDLLLTDISGEDFVAALDGSEDAKRLTIIAVAAHFVLLVDSSTLRSPRTRHAAAAKAKLLVRSLIEAGVLSARSRFELVITKMDTLVDADPAMTYVDRFLEEMQAQYSSKLGEIMTVKIAARPRLGGAPVMLDALLKLWCEPDVRTTSHFTPVDTAQLSPYDRFVTSKGGV